MRAIKTQYFGPTNSKGSRIKASNDDNKYVTVAYQHQLNSPENHQRACALLLEKLQWTGNTVCGSFGRCVYHVFIN